MDQIECFDKKSIQIHIEILQKLFKKYPEAKTFYLKELELYANMVNREKIFKCIMGIGG